MGHGHCSFQRVSSCAEAQSRSAPWVADVSDMAQSLGWFDSAEAGASAAALGSGALSSDAGSAQEWRDVSVEYDNGVWGMLAGESHGKPSLQQDPVNTHPLEVPSQAALHPRMWLMEIQ